MGAIIQAITQHVDRRRKGKQGEDIVFLADEAGSLRIPSLADTLAHGRSRGITMTAFVQSVGQLNQYHANGWKGFVDTFHHWILWSTNDSEALDFLRERCGIYDKPNPSRNPDERERQPYIETSAFDEIKARWSELEVIAVLDYDRHYPVYGRAVSPYKNRTLRTRPN